MPRTLLLTLLLCSVTAAQEGRPAGVKAINRAAELIREGRPREAREVLEGARGTIPGKELWAWWGYLAMASDDLRDLPAARAAYRESMRIQEDSWFRVPAACHRFWEGDAAEAGRLLKGGEDPQDADLARRLRLALRGPFTGGAGREARSPGGRWRVVADLDDAGGKRQRAIASLLEDFSKEILERLGIPAERWPAGHVATVFIVRDAETWATFARDWSGGAPRANQHGFYDPNVRALLMTTEGKDDLDPDATDTLLHEAWHQIFDLLSRERPLWLNEGLAEYCGKARPAAGGGLVWGGDGADGSRVTRRERLREHLAGGTAIPLPDFVRLDDAAWGKLDPALAYAQAWSLAHHALEGSDRELREAFRGLVQDLAAGKSWSEASEARIPRRRALGWEPGWGAAFRK
ncbi:MAG: DUF1570 domain-containing protein [Candidatus Brocadiae bacterium]|nr:DUF1570 domain-containing protein [Candidatus Brocadiia bacterium]